MHPSAHVPRKQTWPPAQSSADKQAIVSTLEGSQPTQQTAIAQAAKKLKFTKRIASLSGTSGTESMTIRIQKKPASATKNIEWDGLTASLTDFVSAAETVNAATTNLFLY